MRSPWLDVFDGVTNYRQRSNILGFCLEDSLDGEDFAQEAVELAVAHDGATNWMINLVGSHDTARVLTLADGDVDRVLCAMAAMFTLPGVPLIYYGDEVGLDGGDDPGCRAAMPWDASRWNTRILDGSVPSRRPGTPARPFDAVISRRHHAQRPRRVLACSRPTTRSSSC